MWLYAGLTDQAWGSVEELAESEVDVRIWAVLDAGTSADLTLHRLC
jgi:hypothetical protein